MSFFARGENLRVEEKQKERGRGIITKRDREKERECDREKERERKKERLKEREREGKRERYTGTLRQRLPDIGEWET